MPGDLNWYVPILLHQLSTISPSRGQLSDIAHGVEYMHKLKVIHGDITIVCHFFHPQHDHRLTFVQTNVLVDPDGRARVAGLGAAYTASLIPGVDLNETFEVHDAAPELAHLQHSGSANIRPTKENDMHAFGALAYEVSPVSTVSHEQAIQRSVISLGVRWESSGF